MAAGTPHSIARGEFTIPKASSATGTARALRTTTRHLLDGGLTKLLFFNNLVEAGGVELLPGIENT
jgi:hypothetical protein